MDEKIEQELIREYGENVWKRVPHLDKLRIIAAHKGSPASMAKSVITGGERKSKYGNKRTLVLGIYFDSKKEAERYQELLLMKEAGDIFDLEIQPKFVLQEAFIHDVEGKVREVAYLGDFAYKTGIGEDFKMVVEDVKGMKTDVYKLKKKLFLYKFPDIIFKEV